VTTEIYQMVPAPGRTLWFFVIIGGFLLAFLVLLVYFAYASLNTQFEISAEALQIKNVPYGREIPLSELDLERARIVDLEYDHELRPTIRTNGIGLPGYSSGWYRLQGSERGLLFVTERSEVVYIPTYEGYSLLLSLREPEAFLAGLLRAAGIEHPD